MKEDSFSFSLMDFLAYLFPGTMMILAVAAFLGLSPFKHVLSEIPLNLVTGLLLLACAYFLGIAVSSLMVSLEKPLDKFFGLENPTDKIHFEGFEDKVQEAFDQMFGAHGKWSANHFYIARSFIVERMPNCAKVVERQNSLRQMRRNSVLPVMSLGLAGILTGTRIASDDSQQQSFWWGIGLALASLLISIILIKNLIKSGMYKNRKREVREVCAGLLAYYYERVTRGGPNPSSVPAQPNKSFDPTAS